MSDSDLVLALDIGTSSLRSALFDARGRRLRKTTAQFTYSLQTDREGAAELAVADLERAARRALEETLRVHHATRALQDRPIVAVAASCFWHSLLGYDAHRGRPTPIYTWADARCHVDALKLRSELREMSYHARTGCMLRTAYWPAKLRWLVRTGRARGVTHWMSPAEWLYARFTGAAPVSTSMASGTGLLDLRSGQWDDALLKRLNIRQEALGSVSDDPLHAHSDGSKSPLRPTWPKKIRLLGARWFPAIGDGMASNLGSNATAPGATAINVGTSAAMRLVTHGIPARLEPGLFCYRLDSGRALLGGAISNAGNLRHWALQQLRLSDHPKAIERALASRMTPGHGLTVLPFWTGERSPSWPGNVGGTITGITYSTTALDILQALTESTYHRLAQIADLLGKQSARPLDIVVSGGIRHSAESLQRLANVLGRPVRPCVEPEASLRGAAVHALQRLGHKVEPLAKAGTVRAAPSVAVLYASARAEQVALERTLARDC